MKKYIIILTKSIVALLIAFTFMHLFCYVYYNIPMHYDNETSTTDYVWEKHKFYSIMTEGFGRGRTNNEGFNNLKDYNKKDDIDILLIGSSQVQAFNVLQSEGTAALLNKMFNSTLYTYSIGIDGHFLPTSINNLENALNYYKPRKYVIIETFDLLYEQKLLKELLEGTLPPVNTTKHGIKAILQRNHFFHLLNTQMAKLTKQAQNNKKNKTINEFSQEVISLTNRMLVLVDKQAQEANVIPIILYHKPINITNQFDEQYIKNIKNKEIFEKLCNKNNIIFVDMTPIFLENYKKRKTFPYGFNNTAPNTGHLNKYGHKMIAEELYKKIIDLEERKNGIQ